jgi:hypothetical protein
MINKTMPRAVAQPARLSLIPEISMTAMAAILALVAVFLHPPPIFTVY